MLSSNKIRTFSHRHVIEIECCIRFSREKKGDQLQMNTTLNLIRLQNLFAKEKYQSRMEGQILVVLYLNNSR